LAREHDVGFIAMKSLAGGRISNAKIAFKYFMQLPDVVLIPGIQKVQEIEEIVQILEGPRTITKTEQKEMQRLRQKLGTKFCHRCDYCQPCTAEIPISFVLDYPALKVTQSPESLFAGHFKSTYGKSASCTQCGECEERCPFGLPIKEMVEEYAMSYQMIRRTISRRRLQDRQQP